MGLITSSELPGHKLLHERICTALDRCQEFPDVDFKRSASWNDLQWKITRTAIAMGNLRDGGIIVVGVAQRDDAWHLDGVSNEHGETYDTDKVADQFNKYISPHIRFDLVEVAYLAKRFIVIAAHEFTDTPLVCKKTAPSPKDLEKGCVYIRPFGGRPQTTKVTTAEEMHDLLELAAEKRARRILEVSRRVGLIPGISSTEHFDGEVQDIDNQVPSNVLQSSHLFVTFRPELYEADKIPSLTECFKLIEQSRFRVGGWSYPAQVFSENQRLYGSNWIGGWSNLTEYDYWQFYQSTQFLSMTALQSEQDEEIEKRLNTLSNHPSTKMTVDGVISLSNLIYRMTLMFEFAARLCTKDVYQGALTIHIKLGNIQNFVVAETGFHAFFFNHLYQTSSSALENRWTLPIDELVANSREHAIQAVVWFVQRFGWLEPPDAHFRMKQQDIFRY